MIAAGNASKVFGGMLLDSTNKTYLLMRKSLRLIVFVAIFSGAAYGAGAVGGPHSDPDLQASRKAVIEKFMTLMVERQLLNAAKASEITAIDAEMIRLLAPYYFETIGVAPHTLTVNKYSPEGFRIVAIDGPYVFVKLLRKNLVGPTLIVFKTAEASGEVYIEPSSVNLAGKGDPSLVTPWFYAAGQVDTRVEDVVLPKVGKASAATILPATGERTMAEGVVLVNKLMNYAIRRKALRSDDRQLFFKKEILPIFAEGYTNIYGIALDYYEDVAIENMNSCKIVDGYAAYVVMECGRGLYSRYHFKIVVEDGAAKIMPAGIDNDRRTISPVWLKD